ncbi:type VI secretion system-associated FHA domain protein TagH [Acidomonas methanolica]|uniref:type VI secretion system-associated FHA domain protein TagH n=1 Tax=Acidomonas methanolica TaxID=437 RepID=UPI00211A3334|nr:type VI secretion system-associated FHA domain protein TagH [Acidomonas methanolica]MCQ9154979.1 type VI secretion system-associated FHA domain protein TagH [Acidomonas methanolica]
MADLSLVPRRVPSGVALTAFRVQAGTVSLGRGAHCDWILPDPQRLLSKRHCEIALHNGRWMITDLSSNGTTVCGKMLPPGVPQELHDGDSIGCGSYQVDVVLGAVGADEPTQTFPAAGFAGGTPVSADAPHPPHDDEHSTLREPRDTPDGAAPVFTLGDQQRYGRGSVETLSIIHPFSLSLGENESGFDLPGGTASGEVSSLSGRASGQASGLHDAFQPPRPASHLLPEDWDIPAPGLPEGGGTDKAGYAPFETKNETLAGTESVSPPRGSESVMPRVEGVPPGERRGVAHAVRAPVPDASGPTPSSGDRSRDVVLRAEIAAAFLHGAGLAGLSGDVPDDFFEELGRTFRAFVVGLRRAMIARAKIKGEFRIEQTMIQPFGNNPLKFAVDDDDALSALLGVGRRTGVSGADAVTDALDDIRVHEMAVTRAIEPALRDFLAANGPNAVLEQLAFPADQPLSLLRRARAWSSYVRLHEDLSVTATETLDGAFGRAFGRAYEAAREEIEAGESSAPNASRAEKHRTPEEER